MTYEGGGHRNTAGGLGLLWGTGRRVLGYTEEGQGPGITPWRPVGVLIQDFEKEHEHHLFPLSHRAEGRQQGHGLADQVSVKGGLEVNPVQAASVVLGSGENVGDKVVLVKEPAMSEDVENVEDRQLLEAREGICRGGPQGCHSSAAWQGEQLEGTTDGEGQPWVQQGQAKESGSLMMREGEESTLLPDRH